MRLKSIAAIIVAAALVISPGTAVFAADPEPARYKWVLTFDDVQPGTSTAPKKTAISGKALSPRTSEPSPQQAAADDEDLKHECGKHPEAQTDQGWPHSRFDQCFLRTGAQMKFVDTVTQETLGKIYFSASLLVFAYDGQRRIDYVFSFDDFRMDFTEYPDAAPYYESTLITVSFAGCGTLVICSSNPPARAELAPAWQAAPSRMLNFSITSNNDVGEGKFKVLHSLMSMSLSAVTAAGNVLPYQQTLAYSRGRFDSAQASLGAGKHWGAIMPDFIPTLELDRSATSTYQQEAAHVDDALHRPIRTFPSFAGKSVPGEGGRPLHRLMDQTLRTANNNASRGICQAVWGGDYAKGGLECDEYPFQSTYEGSFVSAGGNPSRWNGSARPIDGGHNSKGGTHIELFYGRNRVLDENLESSKVGPTDPFNVKIVG